MSEMSDRQLEVRLQPTGGGEREPILDALRGFALLGILLINIELMRGAELGRTMSGEQTPSTGADAVVHFLTGWLAAGKFISSFAIMFGIGAALIATRSWRSGRAPRPLLARRYLLLLPLGLAHMLLLFPGDILFAYGLAGLVLLVFVGVRARTALLWAGSILAVLLILGVGLSSLAASAAELPADDPAMTAMEDFLEQRREEAVAAHQDGGYGDVIVAHAWEALVLQVVTLLLLPWILALFLMGYAVGRSGVVQDLSGHRRQLRTAMSAGLAIGLPLNIPTGMLGPLSTGAGVQPGGDDGALVILATVGQIVGAPILAVGYLSAVALLCLRIGPIGPLVSVGRMALTAYLLQSTLTLIVFAGFGLYERLTPPQGMLVVFGVWAVLLVVCPLWMSRFRFGPVEWLWRTATYGHRQPMRRVSVLRRDAG